jgi:hypothetical protein
MSCHGVAAQVEFESKIQAKLKAVYHILVSSAEFLALHRGFDRGNLHRLTTG